MISDARLKELIDYARALHVLSLHGRGNVKDTREILDALHELQAAREFGAKELKRRVA